MPKRINTLKLPPIKPEQKNILVKISGEEVVDSLGEPEDYVRLTPEIDFLIEQKKAQDIKQLLKQKRERAEFCATQLAQQWKSLEQKEQLFQRTIVSHNRFVKRNLEKRERAFSKIQNDMEINKKRTRDIKTLSQKYTVLKDVLEEMRNQMMKHSIYEKYLNSVLAMIECPFKMVFDFLTTFEVLLEIKEYCMNRQNKEMTATILMQGCSVNHLRQQQIVFVGIRNEVNNLSVKYDETVRRNLASEDLLRRVMIKSADLYKELTACQHSIDAIYRYICQRRGIVTGSWGLKVFQPKMNVIKYTLKGYQKLMPVMQRKYNPNLPKKKFSILKEDPMWSSDEKIVDRRHSSKSNPFIANARKST